MGICVYRKKTSKGNEMTSELLDKKSKVSNGKIVKLFKSSICFIIL